MSYEFQVEDIVIYENLFWVVCDEMEEKEKGQLLNVNWCNDNKKQVILVCQGVNREDINGLNFLKFL